jgi:hypothetical protein
LVCFQVWRLHNMEIMLWFILLFSSITFNNGIESFWECTRDVDYLATLLRVELFVRNLLLLVCSMIFYPNRMFLNSFSVSTINTSSFSIVLYRVWAEFSFLLCRRQHRFLLVICKCLVGLFLYLYTSQRFYWSFDN